MVLKIAGKRGKQFEDTFPDNTEVYTGRSLHGVYMSIHKRIWSLVQTTLERIVWKGLILEFLAVTNNSILNTLVVSIVLCY